jgi:hypothetical protein
MMRRISLFILLLTSLCMAAHAASGLERRFAQLRRDLDRYRQVKTADQDAIIDLQDRIFRQCLELLNDPRSAAVDLMTTMDHGMLQVAASNDQRLWLLSLDRRTGGSFWERRTLAQLRFADGTVSAFALGDTTLDGYANCALSTAWFEAPVQLDDSTYFTVASIIGCSTCIDLCAVQLRISDRTLAAETFFSFSGRMGMATVFGIEEDHTTFNYVYDQLQDDPIYTLEGLPKQSGSFRYMEGRFQELSHCESR